MAKTQTTTTKPRTEAKPAIAKEAPRVLPTNRAPTVILRERIDEMRPEFAKLLPRSVALDRFVRSAQSMVNIVKHLDECSPSEVAAECMKAANDGLVIDGRQACLVVYNNKIKKGPKAGQFKPTPKYIPMYQGLIHLIRNSGMVKLVFAHVVHENDEFDLSFGDTPHVHHKPAITGRPGKCLGAYSVVRFTDEPLPDVEWMTYEALEAIKARSKAKDSGPWVTDKPEMYKKTVLRRHSKRMPLSPELHAQLASDDDLYEPEDDAGVAVPKTRRGAAAVLKEDEAAPIDGEVIEGTSHRIEDDEPEGGEVDDETETGGGNGEESPGQEDDDVI